MPAITVFTAARMAAIEATAIVGGYISGDTLILTRKNNATVTAGNVRGPKGDQGIQGIQGIQGVKGDQGIQGIKGDTGNTGPAGGATLANIAGSEINLGSLSGTVNFGAISGVNADTLINAVCRATLSGNVVINTSSMPSGVRAGTQFAIRFTQDGTGGRTLTLTNFYKPGGSLVLSTASVAMDILVFMYDGTNWWATLAGKDFKQ